MLHCAQYQVNGYSGGFNADELAEASYVRSADSFTIFLSKSPRSTSFTASEYLFEGLNAFVIGNPERFAKINSLFEYPTSENASSDATLDSPEWLIAVNDTNSAVDMDGIAITIQSISTSINNVGPAAIDLSRVSRISPNPQHLVALLRTTYPFRNEVHGWYELRNFAKEALPKRGYKPESVMRGLLA